MADDEGVYGNEIDSVFDLDMPPPKLGAEALQLTHLIVTQLKVLLADGTRQTRLIPPERT